MRSRVSAWLGHLVAVYKFSVLVSFGTQKLTLASVRSTSFSSDGIRTSAGWCCFFLAATGAPIVPFYLLPDDRCHSQLNKYSEEPLSVASVRREPASLFTHNRCPYWHWCPHRTKYCLLKALHSPVHPTTWDWECPPPSSVHFNKQMIANISIYDL